VELGTASGWTTASLALADPARIVASYDPVAQPGRDDYLALMRPRARARVRLMRETGELGAQGWTGPPVDFLFIDSSHAREDTLAEFRGWRRHLAKDAFVVFHDYGHPAFPGVAEAIEELGLEGKAIGGAFTVNMQDQPA
jgi:hypothetical protein